MQATMRTKPERLITEVENPMSELVDEYYEEAYDIYSHEGFKGEMLEELIRQDIMYRLEAIRWTTKI